MIGSVPLDALLTEDTELTANVTSCGESHFPEICWNWRWIWLEMEVRATS